jgi:hypothetical protein
MKTVHAAWVLLVCAACGRPSSPSAMPVALPPGEVASLFPGEAAPPTFASTRSEALPILPATSIRAAAGPDRGAVPILHDRGDVGPGFARAAPPSPAHPRGTIAVEARFFDGPGSTHGRHDLELLEVDLATGAHVRTVEMGKDWLASSILDGASGPIEVMWKSPTLEVFWFDSALVERAHRSLTGVFDSTDQSYLSGKQVVGDRVVFAFPDGVSRTHLWLLDSSGTVIRRTCPATWRPEADILENGDDVVVEPIGGDDGLFLCAVRADGTGKVRSRPYYESARVVRVGRRAYFSVSHDDDAGLRLPPGLYPVGPDLLPVQPAVKDPTPPEAIAAGVEFHEAATLVNGVLVLVRSPCCGNGGPFVWLLDPRLLPDGGNE